MSRPARPRCGDPHCQRTTKLIPTRKGPRCKKHADRLTPGLRHPRGKAER